ncbi:MAG TPA: DUF4138 domain-containing protein, partial [Fibrella sp.]
MKRLIISVSTLLILSAPSIAQRKPTYLKRTYTKQLARRDTSTRSSVPSEGALSILGQQKSTGQADSVRLALHSFPQNASSSVVSASSALRTSPEAPIQPQHIIRSYYVDLAYNKTVSIIFPTSVRSVDLGSRSIMADKAADVENVLKVKAAQIGFNETNFSVMTADGKFYSFVVNYNETPAVLALNLAGINPQPKNLSNQVELDDRTQFVNGVDAQEGHIQFAGVNATQSDIVYASNRILSYRGRGKRGAKDNKMEARLRGLYVKNNVLYYRL